MATKQPSSKKAQAKRARVTMAARSKPGAEVAGARGATKAPPNAMASKPQKHLQSTLPATDKSYAWTCPVCGFVANYIPGDDEAEGPPQGTVAINANHHASASKGRCCNYAGGWWKWQIDKGWVELAASPRLHLTHDGFEMETQEGGYLGLIPGSDPDKWVLHMLRATDPAYPTLMDDEMQWLATVETPDTELNRYKASSLVGRYTYALRKMERHLVNLFQVSKHDEIRSEIGRVLRLLYDDVKHHVVEAANPPSPTYDKGIPCGRHVVYHSKEANAAVKHHERAKKLAAVVLGTGVRKRPADEECVKWANSRMYSAWEIIENLRKDHAKPKLQNEVMRLQQVVTDEQLHRRGISFEDLWKRWLRSFLEEAWEANRPLINGRTHAFKQKESSAAYAAALFWCHYLSHYEPQKVEASNLRVKKALESITGT